MHEGIHTDDIQEAKLLIDGDPWFLLQSRVELSTASTPDYVNLILAPTPSTAEDLPDDPTLTQENGGLLGATFELIIDTELSAGPRGNEITKIFTGNLANLSRAGQGAWEGIAWDPSHQVFASGEGEANAGNFLNSRINIPASSDEPKGPDSALPNGQLTTVQFPTKGSLNTPSATMIRATNLVELIIEASPLESYQVETHFADSPGVKIGTRPDGSEVYGGIDRYLFFSNQRISISDALERIENATNSTWWFDRDGIFHIGAPTPGNPIQSYNLKFITDTTAGKTTPAWQGVRVIGSGVVSEDGWDRANMNPDNPAISAARLSENGVIDEGKLAEPVFTYRNLEIQTKAEADAVAKEIVNKLQKQQADGTVSVVGFPEIRPLDAIEMPNTEHQPMGGARYSVQKVVHKINPKDGFITDIHVGGLTRESSTLYEEDIDLEKAENVFGGGAGAGGRIQRT